MSGVGDWVPAGLHLIFDQAIVFSLFVLLSLLLFFFWKKDTIGLPRKTFAVVRPAIPTQSPGVQMLAPVKVDFQKSPSSDLNP